MKRDDVIRIASEAGILFFNYEGIGGRITTITNGGQRIERMQAFASIAIEEALRKNGQYLTNDASREAAIREAVEAEREACAKAVEEIGQTFVDQGSASLGEVIAYAARIRARGQA